MSVSPCRPARTRRALLGLVLAAPAGLLVVPSASAAARVDVEPLAEGCGVRLSFAGLPAGAHAAHLDLVALDPVQALALTPAGPRQVDGGGPSVADVAAEGLAGAGAGRTYRAIVSLDGEQQPPVELLLPECADRAAAQADPSAPASPAAGSPVPGTSTPSPSGTPSAPSPPSATASPAASPAASPTASPTATTTTAPTASATPTATITTLPSEAPVFGPRAVGPVTATGGSGVIALSGAVAAAALTAPPLTAPAPVVAPPAGGVAAAVAAAPPLAAALPALPGRPAPAVVAPAPRAAAPELAAGPPAVAREPASATGPWGAGLPAALLVTGAAAGALGLRLRRRA